MRSRRLQQISGDVVQVQQGSLYPALHRLENRGLLAGDWNLPETGREAKFYNLTARGGRLKTERANWGFFPERWSGFRSSAPYMMGRAGVVRIF